LATGCPNPKGPSAVTSTAPASVPPEEPGDLRQRQVQAGARRARLAAAGLGRSRGRIPHDDSSSLDLADSGMVRARHGHVLIGCDSVEQVEEWVELARSLTPLSQAQMAAMEAKVEPAAKQALFFRLMPR